MQQLREKSGVIRIHLKIPSDDSDDTARLYSLPGILEAAQGLIGNPGHVMKFYLRLDSGTPEIIARAEPEDVTH